MDVLLTKEEKASLALGVIHPFIVRIIKEVAAGQTFNIKKICYMENS